MLHLDLACHWLTHFTRRGAADTDRGVDPVPDLPAHMAARVCPNTPPHLASLPRGARTIHHGYGNTWHGIRTVCGRSGPRYRNDARATPELPTCSCRYVPVEHHTIGEWVSVCCVYVIVLWSRYLYWLVFCRVTATCRAIRDQARESKVWYCIVLYCIV